MAFDRAPSVNQRLSVEVLAGTLAGRYSSQFVDERAEGFVIAAPITQGVALAAPAGTLLKVDWTGESAVYSFESELLKLESGVIALWVITKPEVTQRMQRRTHVRLDASLPILYTILAHPNDPNPELSAQQNMTVFRGRTRDLSGGGSMLVIDQKLESGTLVDMEIQLRPRETINLMGEIVRIIKSEEKGRIVEHWTGVKFLDVNEREMDTIISFIFEEQRRLRRRGLI
ncbi:MAG TPA: PilZ domain-containing protein [Bacillota bacterium]